MMKMRKAPCVTVLVLVMCSFAFHFEAFYLTKGGNTMQITSTVFKEGSMITAKYTCDGQDISPPLEWKDVPPGTKSFALIMDDPDAPAGTWVHWIIFNIPPDVTKLDENVRPETAFKNGMKQGENSWPRIGYGGPCPPSGTHRYYFKLYALDIGLNLKPGATKAELIQAMRGHILSEAQLMGKYRR
jgi:Raf kinase inhibitor-like YbhB/YbcL family protein